MKEECEEEPSPRAALDASEAQAANRPSVPPQSLQVRDDHFRVSVFRFHPDKTEL